jgi:hypothetical protein
MLANAESGHAHSVKCGVSSNFLPLTLCPVIADVPRKEQIASSAHYLESRIISHLGYFKIASLKSSAPEGDR